MTEATENKEPHATKNEIGSVRLLRKKLWKAIERAEKLLDSEDKTVALKSINSLGIASGVWLKCYNSHVLEKRLEQLEKLLPDVKLGPNDDTED
jgi:hypothetical protein